MQGASSSRSPVPTWNFAVVLVRLGHRVLLVHERKHGQKWYLPAGRVEPGETFTAAAERETLEEAGVRIVVEGVIRVEHTPWPDGTARCRVLFVARPADDTPPKREPDEHSLEAAWVALEELAGYDLRGEEVLEIARYVADGGAVYPASLIALENTPLRAP